jgi:hypothetical protein
MLTPRDIWPAISRLARDFLPLKNILTNEPPPPAANDNTPPADTKEGA